MVNPTAANALPVIMPNTSSTPDATQPHKQDAAVVVQASAESRGQSQDYQRWPKEQPVMAMGELIKTTPSSLDDALEQLNKNMEAWATGLRFDVDEDTQRLVVSLVDSKSGEVIRAVPSDAVLQMSKMIAQFQGNTINTKA